MIEVYLPDKGEDEKLANQVQPYGWEHLAGPFAWCEPTSQNITESGGRLELPVRIKDNTMGTMAKHFHEHRQLSHSNLLFIGPPGNGKSAIEKFLAWVYLSEDHEPVSYKIQTGEDVTLVDHRTGEPFVINPTNENTITYDFVQRKLSTAVLPEEVDPSTRLQLHNAGNSNMNKSSVSELADDLKRDLSMIGRRVVVISEIHDFSQKSQTRPLKTEIDPAGMPDGLLIMADANDKAAAEKSLGKAGMGRFEIIDASRWHADTLRLYADEYCRHFGISFEGEFEQEPERIIAQRAGGSIRELLFLIQNLRNADQPVTESSLNQLVQKRVEDEGRELSRDVYLYFNNVAKGNRSTAAFVDELLKREVSVHHFLRDVCHQLSSNHREILTDPQVQSALAELRESCHYTLHEGPPAKSVVWASIVKPLDTLASRLTGQ